MLPKSKRRKRNNRRAPGLEHGFARGFLDMVSSYIIAILIPVFIESLKPLAQDPMTKWVIVIIAIILALITVSGIIEARSNVEKSKYWNNWYILGYAGGTLFGAWAVLKFGGQPDIVAVIVAILISFRVVERMSRKSSQGYRR